jgi:hypothetical protein
MLALIGSRGEKGNLLSHNGHGDLSYIDERSEEFFSEEAVRLPENKQ